ncbi:MAG: glycosyltransferase family 4 protein [Candidatus Andersenbacteria bacterium]|nr:glycosyltransferase family 4 protein [Candidatus Andersenbacteria bacterium]
MKIAILSTIEESVPPVKYGGIEVVVANLAEGLVKKGHDVTLFGTGDSKTSAKLVPLVPKAIRRLPEAKSTEIREMWKHISISQALSAIKEEHFDIIHSHTSFYYVPFAMHAAAPSVTTLHGSLEAPVDNFVFPQFPDHNYISISNNQREPLPQLNYVATVYNGIDVNKFTPLYEPGKYLAFLGRIMPDKGIDEAIKVARHTGLPLKIAAKIDPYDQEYYDQVIKPQIDGQSIEYLGEVDHAGKNELLKNAIALLFPILWREPFGLVMAEAMACGTPVIGLRRGSVEEVVSNGETGFVVDTMEEMVEAVKKISTIKRELCRQRAEANFSMDTMISGYEAAYKKII